MAKRKDKEEEQRQAAARMYKEGEGVSSIARRLGRSRQWVYKWVYREDGSEGWSKSMSKAPHRQPSATSPNVVEAIVEARRRLQDDPYMESGAYAVYHDIQGRGIVPPSVSTINRVLRRRGLSQAKSTYTRSGMDYPDEPLNMQLMDLIGPRYLRGGQRYYLLTIISNETRHAGVYPILSKCAADITNSVVDYWKSYSVPDFLQLDNELSFKGSNRHPRGLGQLIRTALELNVVPRFIPVGEPWRNGVIERFNQKVERTLLSQRHEDFEALRLHAAEFVRTHNARHHYSPLGHKTPDELDAELGDILSPLCMDYQVRERPPLDCLNGNEIDFIRLVRSDLRINVLNTEIEVVPSLMHSYVVAKLLINKHRLVICQDDRVVQVETFAMPVD